MTRRIADSERPLSPHITVYRWPITMIMSIAHRITGGMLYFGTLFLVIWLVALACGEHSFQMVQFVYDSLFGRLVLFFYSFALIQHLVGGIRHLFWDVKTNLLNKQCATIAAKFTVILSIVLTAMIWIIFYTIVG